MSKPFPDPSAFTDLPAIPKPFERKAAGWILLNGNVVGESDLAAMFHARIVNPQHFDPQINASRKVLLVTAAFNRGHEHHDRHLIAVFEKLGIDADWQGGLPQNVQNLSIYSMFLDFKNREPWIYRRYTEKQDLLHAIKRDYGIKNWRSVRDVRQLTAKLAEDYPPLGLYELHRTGGPGGGIERILAEEETSDRPDREETLKALRRLHRSPSDLKRCQKVYHGAEHVLYKDEEIFSLCGALEDHYLEKSGVRKSALYQQQRSELMQRILSSATVFLFGGRVFVLLNRLRFYDLADAFRLAVERGTNLYGISAGAICQTERVSLTYDRGDPNHHIHAADYGMGLVRGLRIFPHANDFKAIRESHRDDLTLFALRMPSEVAVGLNERSVLLCERYRDPLDGEIYSRYSSVGLDPVLVFGPRGKRREMERYAEILLPDSRFYEGKAQVATREEIVAEEQARRRNPIG